MPPRDVTLCLPCPLDEWWGRLTWLVHRAVIASARADELTRQLAEQGWVKRPAATELSRCPAQAQDHWAGLFEQEAIAQRAWDEAGRLGALVTDQSQGALDVEAHLDGKTVRLCWRHGESHLDHWHDGHEGCHRRRPLKSSNLRLIVASQLDLH